ncbi:MAG: ankyrin repeat domain-containing protein [Verrucomicrobia bacterium]|nr:ankyrin repeat domain-containing protein [Verrucomicrobiota bacterium]
MNFKVALVPAALWLAFGQTIVTAADNKPNVLDILAQRSERTLEECLMDAALANRPDEIEELVRQGAKVDARRPDFQTPLMWCSLDRHVDSVRALIKAGADVNATADRGHTALMVAARNGSTAVVRILLAAKAHVDAKMEGGTTALHQAAEAGNVEVIELLLAAGADISARNEWVGTPLHYANWNADVTRCLLRHGCPIDAPGCEDIYGAPALSTTAAFGHSEAIKVLKLLLEAGANINAQDQIGKTALMHATQLKKTDVLKLLIQSHADLNRTNFLGWTALMEAKFRKKDEAARLLQEAGGKERKNLSFSAAMGDLAAVNSMLAESGDDRPSPSDLANALCLAVREKHAGVTRLLLAHGANPDMRENNTGSTPLTLACGRENDPAIARQLLAAGANVNQTGSRGITALMRAVETMPAEFVKELIAKGAHVNATDDHGNTAFVRAARKGNLKNMEVLLQHGARIDDGKLDEYDSLHALQAPLRGAIVRGDLKVVEFLLAHGSDANARHRHGVTPLMYAAQHGKVDVAKLLILHGANVSAKADCDYNNTAIKLAEHSCLPCREEMVELLRQSSSASKK